MKKIIAIFAFILTTLACSSDDTKTDNPLLPNIQVNFTINLNLPQYNLLKFPGGLYVERNHGIKGVIIYNLNDQQYYAFELSDPNIIPSDCSALKITGLEASSNCGNDNVYLIASGGQQTKGEGNYSLLSYRIIKNGNTLSITN